MARYICFELDYVTVNFVNVEERKRKQKSPKYPPGERDEIVSTGGSIKK